MSPSTSAAPAMGHRSRWTSPAPGILSCETRQLWSMVVAGQEHVARWDRLVAPWEMGNHELTKDS